MFRNMLLKIYTLKTQIFVRFSPSGKEFIRPEVKRCFEKFTRLAAMLDLVWAGSARNDFFALT